MRRLLPFALLFLVLTPSAAQDRTAVMAKAPFIKFVAEGSTLKAAMVAQLSQCKLTFHLKAGMTNSEANDAIDAGYQQFFNCLRRGAAAPPTR